MAEEAVAALSNPLKDILAGSVGGMFGVVSGQPLDTIRVRLQQKNCAYTGVHHAWKSIVTKEGPLSLFKGMAYPLTTATVQTAVTFFSFGATLRMLTKGDAQQSKQPRGSDIFWSGICAGTVQSFVITPVDVLKIRLQLQKALPGDRNYVGPIKLLGQIVRTAGITGLFRGLSITLFRDVPAHGIYFYSYYKCKDLFDPPENRVNGESSSLAMFSAGGVAGVVSWFSVYPFDVVKSRMQAHDRCSSPYRNWMDCGMQAVREEGVRNLLKGLNATLGRAFIVNAAIFSMYELSMSFLDDAGL